MARATVLVVVRDRNRRVWHDSKRVHVTGKLVITAGDYASEVAVGDVLLVTGEHRDVTVITSATALTVGSAFSNNANDLAPKRFKTTDLVLLTGSVNVTASASVVGVGTLFTKEISVGDYLSIGTDTVGETRRVTLITDDTHLTVDAAFTDLADDTTPKKVPASAMVTISGTIDPAASATVTGVNTLFTGSGLPFSLAIPGIPSGKKVVSFQAQSRAGYIYRLAKPTTRVQITGSIDTTASTAVVGVGTLFTKEIFLGEEIFVLNEQRTVVDIADDTHLTVSRAHTDQANDTAPEKLVIDENPANSYLAIYAESASAGSPLNQLATAAVPTAVLDDLIEFEAVYSLV